MMSTPSSGHSMYSPPRKNKRLTPILIAVAVVVVLAVGGGLVAFLGGGDDAAASSHSGPRRTAAELARKGLNCMQATKVTEAVAPAQERVSCATGAGSDAVVSTFKDAKTAKADAEKVLDKLSDDAKRERGMVIGPYWTVNCSLRQVCEAAQAYLDGELVSS